MEKKKTFKDFIGKPFTVYVVFENMPGRIREFTCEIKKKIHIPFAKITIYNLKLYKKDDKTNYYFELYNGAFNFDFYSKYSRAFIKGDGSDVRYAHGSDKQIFLDRGEAIEEAEYFNNCAKQEIEYYRDELKRFKNKK